MENGAWNFDENLDTGFLHELYGDDTDHAKMMFDEFLKSAPGMMEEMEESYKKGVIENFRQKVHKVKPVFSFVGLTHLTKRAEILEYQCKDSFCMNDLSALYEDMKYHYNKNLPIIKREAGRLENQE